jgi:hypothetical protein
MTFSDWSRFILVLLIFAFLHCFIILAVQIDNIKKNWPKWRCNPMVMPFARVFGHDEYENFTKCISTMQSDYMSFLLQPINFDISVITELASTVTDGLSGGFELISDIQNVFNRIFKAIYGAFFSIIVEFQKIIINIKDTFGKVTAVVSIFAKILSGLSDFMQSMKNGPPGTAIEALCFDPETIIKTYNGDFVKIKDIELNTKLKNGSKVLSVMNISNLDSEDNIVNRMYEIVNGENNEKIYVTGSHLIYDAKIKDFIKVSELNIGDKCQLSDNECRSLSCLITSDHSIPIGEWIFHDWEDNNGSPSKNLQ